MEITQEGASYSEVLKKGKRHQWEKFLHAHKLWRPATVEKRLALFSRIESMSVDPAIVQATSLHAVSLAKLLRQLEIQLRIYRERITNLFSQHPDMNLFASLPGAGQMLAPRLLAEIGADRTRFQNAASLQCYAGTAPISFQSGQIHRVKIRRACAKVLRYSVHLWADRSRLKCAWANTYYKLHREKGKSHASALRCLGQRWLKILWKILETSTPYSEAIHMKNQTEHGSWVLSIKPQ
jgi:transposase